MSDIENDLANANANLFVIGTGSVSEAVALRERLSSPYKFLVDPNRVSYKAAAMRKDLGSTLSFRTLSAAYKAWRNGHRQKKIQGDAFQQGGAAVILPDGSTAFHYISQFGGDHPEPISILDALANTVC